MAGAPLATQRTGVHPRSDSPAQKLTVSSIRAIRRFLAGSFVGMAAVAILVIIGVKLDWNLSSTGFLCLLIVMFTATFSGFWEATLVSLLAVNCLNYFFVPPVSTFTIADPRNWVALGSFEITALVVSRLSTKVRDRVQAEASQRRHTERLYELSRRILFMDRRGTVSAPMVGLIREVMEAEAVVLFEASSARIDATEKSPPELETMARNAYLQQADFTDAEAGMASRAVRLGTHPLGGLAVKAADLDKLTMDAIASLAAIALERARSFETESRAEAARQTEQLRTAVLDSLAHAFKTPLTAIRTASSGLLEIGDLDRDSAELARLIDQESENLNRLTTDLLQMARIDAADLHLRRERVVPGELLEQILDTNRDQLRGHEVKIAAGPGEMAAYADRALLSAALLQLMDNAVKYSRPGSPISIEIAGTESEVVVSVHNEGPSIKPGERERIFDRFYRTPESRHRANGTGLGLSIVKKTAEAHNGRVWVVSENGKGTTLCLAVPRVAGRDQ